MLKNKTIAVVVPAYNEESQIITVIETMPDFVDRIVIVNDASTDNTIKVIQEYTKKNPTHATPLKKELITPNKFNRAEIILEEHTKNETKLFTPREILNQDLEKDRVILINHLENQSVGASIATGYKWCRDNKIDCTAVMAGDGQMDPSELESICMPIIKKEVDYVKGNRLRHKSASLVIPKVRFFGNSILSLLTKIASGYWHVSDTQTGYTAISLEALQGISLHKIYKTYGVPNDILVKLNILSFAITEVVIKPVYNVGEKSKMKVLLVIPKISFLLMRSFWKRLYTKYLFRDFHPLFLLYHFGFILILVDIPFFINGIMSLRLGQALPMRDLILFTFLTISGFQSLFFAMWMDMMDNERLHK